MPFTHQEKVVHFPLTILLVENDEIAARVAIGIFEKLNCRVDWVKTGEDAIEKYKSHEQLYYDLILMDIGLPTIDGLKTTEQIRLLSMRTSNLLLPPIIGLSGITELQYKSKCFEAGMSNLIAKPLTSEAAQDILQKFVIEPRYHELHQRNDIQELALVSGKILDIDTLYDLIEKSKDHKTMRKMVDEAIETFPEKQHEIELAHQEGNWKKIYAVALQLSGESAYYGMERLKQACAQMMENIRSPQNDYVEALYEELVHEISVAKDEYSRLKKEKIL